MSRPLKRNTSGVRHTDTHHGQVNGIEMVPNNQSEGIAATAPNRLGNSIRALPKTVTPLLEHSISNRWTLPKTVTPPSRTFDFE